MKTKVLSVHIFRRDLRLEDNTALLAALSNSEKVLPIFIFDERQMQHPFKGLNSFEFMLNSLCELDAALKKKGSQLYFFKGLSHQVINELLLSEKIEGVFVNRDYTPFSKERDTAISGICKQHKVSFSVFTDALLTEPEQVYKNDGSPYIIFTPFMNKARNIPIADPVQNNYFNYYSKEIQIPSRIYSPLQLLEKKNSNLRINGGRKEGLSLLNEIKGLNNYNEERNIPAINGTSLLSAHHKFGTISIRESYNKIIAEFDQAHSLINELYWRDFFTHVIHHFPKVLGEAFREKYQNIVWENNTIKFDLWCKGETGFPIVDAGMRELVSTGYMHNRIRMIVASFLTKDLHIDWRWGERFFAQHLIDYDPAVNNGNWQWAASTGCDAQPYFRIFNPWRQQQKFDPQCEYIKKWVPELRGAEAKVIHENNIQSITAYLKPIVDHSSAAAVSLTKYKEL